MTSYSNESEPDTEFKTRERTSSCARHPPNEINDPHSTMTNRGKLAPLNFKGVILAQCQLYETVLYGNTVSKLVLCCWRAVP